VSTHVISSASSYDARFPLPPGAGTDAVHTAPVYSLAVTRLKTDQGPTGTGITLTLGEGNRIVCELIDLLAPALGGLEIDELMADFGQFSRRLSDHPQLRWLGPHKGAVHLALASITNACFDLWAKSRGVPLWRLLLDLSPNQLARLLDLRYVEDELTPESVEAMFQGHFATRAQREPILARGYPGYDTSVGWFGYDDDAVREKARQALGRGFRALKLKVGSVDPERDLRRARMLRELAGADSLLMVDANQQWTLPQAFELCEKLRDIEPFWIEEPTHPDDVLGHARLAKAIAPLRIAAGEHLPNRVVFKNYLHAQALHFVQADCCRLAGISEYITVSLLARKYGLPVVPHAGDMGQIHQSLVLFDHIALDAPVVFLEHIPHLRAHFKHPARVEDGVYRVPQAPGCASDLVELDEGAAAKIIA
jgi:L-fuconate dehydratase